MANFDKYKNVDVDALNKEVNGLSDGDFENLPEGEYEVRLEELELKPTKKSGDPMLAIKFKVLAGDYKNRLIFVNQVVLMGDDNDKYRVHSANVLLRGLTSDEKDITFNGIEDYEELINEIAEEKQDHEYAIKLTYKNEYAQYKILEEFE